MKLRKLLKTKDLKLVKASSRHEKTFFSKFGQLYGTNSVEFSKPTKWLVFEQGWLSSEVSLQRFFISDLKAVTSGFLH